MKARLTQNLWWILATVSLIVLTAWIRPVSGSPIDWIAVSVGSGFIFTLALIQIPVGDPTVSLAHAFSVSIGLAIGPGIASLSLFIGITLGFVVRLLFQLRSKADRNLIIEGIKRWGLDLSTQILSLSAGLSFYLLLGGNLLGSTGELPRTVPALALSLIFSSVFLALNWLTRIVCQLHRPTQQESTTLILIALVPIPVTILSAVAYSLLKLPALLIYGVLVLSVTTIVRNLAIARYDLQRRLQELASFNEVAARLSSTLDLNKALKQICQSLIRVAGGNKSAVFLISEENNQLELVSSQDLSSRYIRSTQSTPVDKATDLDLGLPALISDVTRSGLSSEEIGQLLEEDINAIASFPLKTPEGIIGNLTVYFNQIQEFIPERVELLKALASQSALAITNARAHGRTDEALHTRVRQLEALEAISRDMASILNVEELYTTILENAIRSVNADKGYLTIRDHKDSELRIITSHHDKAIDSNGILNEEVATRVIDSGNIVNLTQPLVSGEEFGGGTRSLLSVPILHQGKVLGAINLEADRAESFSDEQERFLTQIAAQAAIAISNARLYNRLEASFLEQSLLYQASTQIASTLEAKTVGLAAADSLAVAVSADGACVSRWDQTSQSLSVIAEVVNGRPANNPDATIIDVAAVPILAKCLRQRQSVELSRSKATSDDDRLYLEQHHEAGIILALPMILGERTIGIIEVYRYEDRQFDENALRTGQTIASQTAIALENTDLFQQTIESRDRLMAVLNSTHEGMLMVDVDGRVVLANDQLGTLTGTNMDLLIGESITAKELEMEARLGFHPGELEKLTTALRQERSIIGGVSTFEVNTPRPLTLERTDTPVHDAGGQLFGWLVVLRDVSEEHALEEAREQLTEMIVHDLRSPLTAILGSLKLLEEKVGVSKKSAVAEQAMKISDYSVHQMLRLVDTLLDIAKLESGELELSLAPLSVAALGEEMSNLYVAQANESGIILSFNFEDDLPEIYADAELLRRVFGNLLDNALKFTPAGGNVDLSITGSADQVTISVTDTGPGIPHEFRASIFERFRQVPGTSGRRRGTGLGLAFAKLSIDAHGGVIWVGENKSGGSAFHVRLPLKPPSRSFP